MARRLALMAPEAARWLKNEIARIAESSPQGAEKIATNFRNARMFLAESPRSAQRGVIPGTRRMFVTPHYILTVRIRDGVVEVAAIRSASQRDAQAPSILAGAPDNPAPGDPPSRDPFGRR
jgi:plasmid stabilization system protein ParE